MKEQSKQLSVGSDDNKVNFNQILQEMEHNKYFKDYFLFHEESLDKGLTKIDKDLGLINYFKLCFMKHLEK